MSLRISPKFLACGAVIGAAGIAIAIPASSSGHATISALQPQGASLTAARQTFVLRAPNERAAQNTWKIVLLVPGPVQRSFSVRQDPSWKIRLTRVDTGETSGEAGNKIFATTQVVWTARTPDAEIEPGMFGEWPVRFQNPTTPGPLCFPMAQYYRNLEGKRVKPEIVNWTDPLSSAATPRSCINVTAAP